MNEKTEKRIDCRKCRRFFVTWEPDHPYGCRAMGFKSKRLPSLDVQASSGLPCQAFDPKPDPAKPGG